jgi:hypothetical protein
MSLCRRASAAEDTLIDLDTGALRTERMHSMATSSRPGDAGADAIGELAAPAPALARMLTELAASLAGRTDAPAPPRRVLASALSAVLPVVADARWASITACRQPDSPPVTVASTAGIADKIDSWQFATAQGPSRDALDGRITVGADLHAEQRWPDLVDRIRASTPVRSVVSVPIPTAAFAAASMNLYGDHPLPTPAAAAEGAQLAAAAVATADAAHRARSRAWNLEIALRSSRTISAAVGIIMANRRSSYEEAYDLLRTVSQQSHRKIRDLAEDVVFSGELLSDH